VYSTINCLNKENKLRREEEKGEYNIAVAIYICSVGHVGA